MFTTQSQIEAASQPERSFPKRLGIFAYGLGCYLLGTASLTYAIGFVANAVVPKGINDGTVIDLVPALLINTALLLVFVTQHTIMARPWFKKWWTRFTPKSMERSTFVGAAGLSLAMVYFFWQPQPTVIYDVTNTIGRVALISLSMLGWAILYSSSMMVSHCDLFGLRQVWLEFKRKPYIDIGFRVIGFYRLVRHPLMTGILLAVWATPTMTVGHLFFALMINGYIAFGVTLEERDLIAHFGERYRQYKRSVPAVIPFLKFRRAPQETTTAPIAATKVS